MKSISVVMTYYERPDQLRHTLRSIKENWTEGIELVIIDDGSSEELKAKYVVKESELPAKLIYIPEETKTWVNPSVPYNIGFKQATGDVVMIQNAECIHIGDLFSHVRENSNEHNYIVFSCYNLTKTTFGSLCNVPDDEAWLENVTLNIQSDMDTSIRSSRREMWYHHPDKNPKWYHFCTAISRDSLMRIGGFDERFAKGYCFEDNAFLWGIRRSGIQIVGVPDTIGYVVHQWHPKNPELHGGCPLWEKNRKLYNQIIHGEI